MYSAQRRGVGTPLPGLSSSPGSKARLTAMNCSSSVLAELDAHLVDLLDADAVLAGDGAADLDAQLQDLAAELLGPLQLARVVGVVEDQRVQVAVAGVEHVGHRQAVLLGQLARCGAAPPAARVRGMVPSMQ